MFKNYLFFNYNFIISWGNTLGLELNISKCQKLTFTSCQFPIDFPNSVSGNTILQSAGHAVHEPWFHVSFIL